MQPATHSVIVEDVAWHRVHHLSSIGAVRRTARALAESLGLGPARAAEVGLAVTEAVSNQIKHAGGGGILLRACRCSRGAGLQVVAIDSGPGIPDVVQAVKDGHSTAGTLGIGLGAVARLASWYDLYSSSHGTVLAATFGSCTCTTSSTSARAAGVTRAMSGQAVCGDAYAVRVDGPALTVILADGLGHGPLAATASTAAVRAFTDAPFGPPAALLAAAHQGARGTRGAAVAVAQFTGDGSIRYCGAGNISGHVVSGQARRQMMSYPGIAGVNARTPHELVYELPSHAVVIMHSDGVTDRMTIDGRSGLLARSPVVVAATVLRDFGARNDDACVVAVAPPAPS
jgi:anti-sigma regulatory factor (Ser/Thr protein kinase)